MISSIENNNQESLSESSLFNSIGTYLYFIAFIVYIIYIEFTYTTLPLTMAGGILSHATFVEFFADTLISIKILFFDKLSIKNLILFFIMLIFFAISSHLSGTLNILDMFIFVYGASNIDLRKIAKIFFFITFFITILGVILSKIGYIPNFELMRNGDSNLRQSFGKVDPTAFSATLFYMLCSMVYWLSNNTKKYIKLFEIIFILIISFVVYKYTQTRTDFICSLMLIIIVLFKDYSKFFHFKPFKLLILIFPTFIFLLSLYLTIYYNASSAFFANLNDFLSNRLFLASYAYNQYPPTLLGQFIPQVGNGNHYYLIGAQYFYIDSSFMRLLLMNGIIVFVIFYLILQTYFIVNINNYSNYKVLLLLMVTMLAGVFSSAFIVLGFNPILLVLLHNKSTKSNKIKNKNMGRYVI